MTDVINDMCSTKLSSALFAASGFASYAFLKRHSSPWTHIHILFYSVMELLQFVQHFVLDDCENPVNYFSAIGAYVLIWLQPIMFNYRFYKTTRPATYIHSYNIVLSVIAAVLAMDRVSLRLLHPYPPSYGETCAAPRFCALSGTHHLKWSFPMYTNGGFEANFLWYFVLNTLPAFWTYGLVRGSIQNAVFLSGAVVAYNHTGGNMEETMAYWCFISIPYLLIETVYTLFLKKK
jgi:hypothetical protein